MSRSFIVRPQFGGHLLVGSEGNGSARVLVGRLAEAGGTRTVHLDVSKEFVALVLGKRGSGKSYMLGSLIEGLAANGSSAIAQYPADRQRPAVLLLDPLMGFWTTAIPAAATGARKVREAYQSLSAWGIQPESVDCRLWIPAGFKYASDFPAINEFQVRARDLTAGDWADLCGVNLIREPQGILLGECWFNVVEEGYEGPHGHVDPNPDYTVNDLIRYLETLDQAHTTDHAPDTIRALRRTLRGYARLPLFTGAGTPLTDMLRPGGLSILMLPPRIGHDLRRVLTRMLIRRILRERENACHIKQQLDIAGDGQINRGALNASLANLIPKTILAIDEAQELLGEEGGEARKALEDFCLQGRGYGLSLVLATQRPGAISQKVRAQADTHFIHRLLTDDDIEIVRRNLLAAMPEEIRHGNDVLEFTATVRNLDIGQCLVTGSNIRCEDARSTTRNFLMNVRPRLCVHGGEVD